MVNCLVSDLHEVPNNGKSVIVKAELSFETGKFVFDNGTPFEFPVKSINHIKKFKCAPVVEFFSKNASHAFATMDRNGVSYWTEALKIVTEIRFAGVWDVNLLAHLVSNATHLNKMYCTYWRCQNIPRVLEAIGNPNYNAENTFGGLEELSLHVDRKQLGDVVNAVGCLGTRFGPTIKCLTIVVKEIISENSVTEFETILSKVLHPGAQVTILVDGDGSGLDRNLVYDGFIFDGRIRVASNGIYSDDTNEKKFDSYHLYMKKIRGMEWIIGSRIGTTRINSSFNYPSRENSDKEDIKFIRLDPANPHLSYRRYNDGTLPFKRFHRAICFQKYNLSNAYSEAYERTAVFGDKRNLLNGAYGIHIRKIIYHETLTEFFTSNGFYVVLGDMCDEADFLEQVTTTSRFVLHCTSSRRRHIVYTNMHKFLGNASHIEFIGTWHSSTMEMFAKVFTPNMTALTMVQIEIHTNSCLRNFFSNTPIKIRENLRIFHFDGRGTKDKAVGTIMNAIINAGVYVNGEYVPTVRVKMIFEDLLIIANEYESEFYKCRLDIHVQDLRKMVRPGGSATTVVIEYVSKECLDYAGFVLPPFDVLAPIAYPFREEDERSTALMSGIKRDIPKIRIYLVIPFVKPRI